MAFKSILKPKESVVISLATGVLVWGLYTQSLPNVAQIHATSPNDINVEAGRKKAAWSAAVVVAGITLLTRDSNVFILGSAIIIALDFSTRHANASSPTTGELVSAGGSAIGGKGYGDQYGQGNVTPIRSAAS